MERMFNGCRKLEELKGINNFNTNKVNNMIWTFDNCIKLKNLDLSNFNTSNVMNMENMFYGCFGLKEIKGIERFNTWEARLNFVNN